MLLNWQESAQTLDSADELITYMQIVFNKDHLVCLSTRNTIYSLELFQIGGYPYPNAIEEGGYHIANYQIQSFATNATQSSIVVAGYGLISPPQHLYRLANGDTAFSPLLNSPLAVWKKIASDSTGQYLVAGQSDTTYKQIYYSHDFGATWTLSAIDSLCLWNHLVCSQNGQYVFAGGDNDGEGTTIFVSNNYGVSFTNVEVMGHIITEMSCNATGQSVVVAVNNIGVYGSSDYGVSWSLLTSLLIVKIAMDETGQNIIGNTSEQTYFSSDAGVTWESQNLPTPQDTNSNVVAISNLVYLSQNGYGYGNYYLVEMNSIASLPWLEIGGGYEYKLCLTNETGQHSIGVSWEQVNDYPRRNTLFISSDYGISWTLNTAIADLNIIVNGVATDSSQTIIVVAANYFDYSLIYVPIHLHKSSDGGQTFQPLLNSPISQWQTISSNSTSQYLVAGPATSQLFYSHDSGETWFPSSCETSSNSWRNLISSSSGQYVFATIGETLYRSNDYGVFFGSLGAISQSGNSIAAIKCDSTGQYCVASVSNEGLFISDDYGESWVHTFTFTGDINSISCDSRRNHIVAYAYYRSDTYLSVDGGRTWDYQFLFKTHNYFVKVSYHYTSGGGFVSASGNGLFFLSNTNYNSIFSLTLEPPTPPIPPTPSVPISDTCFIAGTPILCDQGYVPIEQINPTYNTIDNHTIVAITRTRTHDKYLIRFDKDALKKGVPSQSVTMSSKHKVLFQGRMREAQWFIHRISNVHCVPNTTDNILYHVLLEEHAVIQVNGLWCETLHPENTIAKKSMRQKM
jgi:photosystem II stability/assembly factor-like uncharacterized protein